MIEKTGQDARSVLPDIILEAIRGVVVAEIHALGRNGFRWVRPLHSVLALFDGKTLDGTLDLGDWSLSFTDQTKGHRSSHRTRSW